MDLDLADRKILDAVQENCRLSAEALGEVAGLSPSAALRRLGRLRDAGVVKAEVAVIDPKAVGRMLAMIVSVTLQRDNTQAVDAFLRMIRETPAISQCYFVTGPFDYVLIYAARTMDEFDAFVQRELIANPYVAGTSTSVVMRPIKVGLAVPAHE